MAGSLNHIVNEETGQFKMDLIENMGDAHEALEECFYLILEMTDGDKDIINSYCKTLGYPDIGHSLTTS